MTEFDKLILTKIGLYLEDIYTICHTKQEELAQWWDNEYLKHIGQWSITGDDDKYLEEMTMLNHDYNRKLEKITYIDNRYLIQRYFY